MYLDLLSCRGSLFSSRRHMPTAGGEAGEISAFIGRRHYISILTGAHKAAFTALPLVARGASLLSLSGADELNETIAGQ